MGIPVLNFIISATNRFAPAFDELAAAMTRGAYQGTLMANAVGFALNKVGEGASFVNSKLSEASDLQLTNISTASTFASLTGATFEQSANVMENLNTRLAKSAAALPGITQQYKDLAMGISANLVEAFKNPDGKLRVKDWENSLASITESYTALTVASTKDVGNTKMALTKALSGQASMAELSGMSFFEKNVNVLNELRRLMKDKGVTELRQLALPERIAIIDKAASKFINDDFKRLAANSVDGLIQSYNTTLFDPTEGVFGIMRKFGEGKNITSAFNEYNKLLINLIGEKGLAGNIGKLISALMGWDIDTPMKNLAKGFTFFSGLVAKVNGFVLAINASLVGVKSPGEAWGIVFEKVNQLLTANKFDVVDSIGSIIARFSKWVSSAIKGITDSNIINILLSGLSGLFDSFIQILPNFIVGIITIIPDIINFISNAILSAPGVFAQIGLKLVTGLLTINWGKILYGIFDAIGRINWVNLIGAFVTVSAIAQIISGITLMFTVVANIFSLATFVITPMLTAGITSLISPIIGLLSGIVPLIVNGVILPVGLFIAGLGLAAIAMGYSVDDIKSAASGWAITAEKATGIKVDGLGSAIAATIMGYWQGFKDIGNAIIVYFLTSSTNVRSSLNEIGTVFNKFLSPISQYWSAVTNFWSQALSEINIIVQAKNYWSVIADFWSQGKKEIDYYIKTINKTISVFWDILSASWNTINVYLEIWKSEINYYISNFIAIFKAGWDIASKAVFDAFLIIKQVWEDFKNFVSNLISPIKTSIDNFFKTVDNFFKVIDNFFKSIKLPSIPGFSPPTTPTTPATSTPIIATATNIVTGLINPLSTVTTLGATNTATKAGEMIGDIFKDLTGSETPPAASAKWRGNIPAASNGLFEAIKTESANMPSGAGLAIANTSEFILTPDQMKNFVSNSSGKSISNSFVFGDIVVNGAENVKEIAGAVMREISAQLEEYINGQLA